MSSRRVERISKLLKEVISTVILNEVSDPRMGFVTVTRVKLSGDLRHAVIFYSVVGSEGDRSKTAHALEHARGHVQTQIAGAMQTRVTPIIRFVYDEAIEGSVRVSQLLSEIEAERGEDEAGELESAGGEEE